MGNKQVKVCKCGSYMSCDSTGWYCLDCDHVEPFKFNPRWTLED